MLQPLLQDDEFLRDVETAPAVETAFHLWWLSQSGFLVKWGTRFLLFDPYLSDSLTVKYAETDKPHIRMTARVVAPERLGFVDVVTSSHNHTDHLDGETLRPLLNASDDLTVIVPTANLDFAASRLEVNRNRLRGLNAGETAAAAGFSIHAVPAAHDELDRDERGNHRYLGYVARFGEWSIYHSGDTLRYDGMVELLAPFEIDVALLPINGKAPERQVAGNLRGREAARLAKDIGASIVVPCHYDLFSFNTATPDEFVHECHRLDQPYRVLRAGERWTSIELRDVE